MNIKHIEANVRIYFTRDYSIFNKVSGNRALNERKIERIKEEIIDGFDMLRYCPIIVDKDMNVIDGQHRLQVAKQLKSNIWYVITDAISLYEIAKLNTNTDKWKKKDFLNCYITLGVEDYKKLDEFQKKYNMPLSSAAKLLYEASLKGYSEATQVFQSGNFKVKHLELAEKTMDLCLEFSAFEKHKAREFIQAIVVLIKNQKCDFDWLLEKFNQNTEALVEQVNYKNYLTNLEEIYNRHSRTRKVIF